MINIKLFGHRFIANLMKYRYLLVELIKRDIKLKYRRSVLGIFWSFLEPLLFMVVLTIIFSTFFAHNIENYPVYLLTGRLTFDLFSRGSSGAMRSILRNAAIIKKVYVPKYMYTLGVVLSNFVTFLLSLVVLLLVMMVTQAPFTLYMLLSVVPIILLLIFTIGVGLILATITVFFRDITHLYRVFITLVMYGSAIFYPASIVPANYQFLLYLNPVFIFISLMRDSFLYGTLFNPLMLGYAVFVSFLALGIGMVLFYKYQDKFILHI